MKNGDYILVVAPKIYPGRLYRDKYCYEHHLVWWQNTGETISDGEIIHHKDKNKQHNAYGNLEKKTASDHSRLHGLDKTKQNSVDNICPICNAHFVLDGRIYKSRRKEYGERWIPCCSRRCQVRKQYKDKKDILTEMHNGVQPDC